MTTTAADVLAGAMNHIDQIGLTPTDYLGSTLQAQRILAALPPEVRANVEAALVGATPNRFEVIDHRTEVNGQVVGRVFVAWPCTVELSYQDGGRTLKAFVGFPATKKAEEMA